MKRIKKKTIIEIANKSKWQEVKKAYKFFYPKYSNKKTLEKLEEIFEKIKKYPKVEVNPREFIEVIYYNDFDMGYDEEYFSIHTNKYSLSFRKWKTLANMKVDQSNMTNAMIMAHFLWEITFYGYDEREIQKVAGKVDTDFNECIKQVEEANKKKTKKKK